MVAGEGPPSEASSGASALEALDRAAGHVIEAHALLGALRPEAFPCLRPLVEALLLEIGRSIAGSLPPPGAPEA